LGSKDSDKFTGIDWSPSELGSPIIEGTLAHIDCTVHSVHDGGEYTSGVEDAVRAVGQPQP
jgi:3-hydroxy-9,10-secoandrosta-1,3,5(10)-triene-9,17-dione monooxygenase reductase component